MAKKTRSLIDKLNLRERVESYILKGYEDTLYKVFQIVYEVDAKVTWERIYRFSPESNFIILTGEAIIPKGTELGSGKVVPKDAKLVASFTIPWEMLEDGSTPYQIAEAAKDIKTFGDIVGRGFVDLIRRKDFTYEQMQLTISDYEGMQKPTANDVKEQHKASHMDDIAHAQVLFEDEDG